MPSEITAEELSKLPTDGPIKSLSPEDKEAWDAYRKGELPKLKQKLAEIDSPTAPPAEASSLNRQKALARRITARLFRISESGIADEMLIVDKLGKPWAVGSLSDVMALIYQEIQDAITAIETNEAEFIRDEQ